jgi:hypothetical protein
MNKTMLKARNHRVKNRQSEMQKKGHGIFHTLFKKEE